MLLWATVEVDVLILRTKFLHVAWTRHLASMKLGKDTFLCLSLEFRGENHMEESS